MSDPELPAILRQKPRQYEGRKPPVDQGDRRRRATYTIFIIQSLVEQYGSIEHFLTCLDELKDYTMQANAQSPFNFEFPKALDDLSVTRGSVIKDLKTELRPHCGTLLTLGRFTRRQITLLTKLVPQMPSYITIRRDWKNQPNISDLDEEDFFNGLEDGIRKFCKKKPDGSYYISLVNMLRWILFLIDDVMEEQFDSFGEVQVFFDFALWAGGGKMYGGIKGLFSALKMVLPVFKDSDGAIIAINHEDIKWLISTAWILSIDQGGESTDNVRSLEEFLLKEYADNVHGKVISYKRFKLIVKLVGWCTDHGYRLKGYLMDSRERCCGECDYSKRSYLYDDYVFLDQTYLLSVRELKEASWCASRVATPPNYLHIIEGLNMSILSYDNHHNMVGHIKKVFNILCSITTLEENGKQKLATVNKRCKEITGKDFISSQKSTDKGKVRRKWPFQGWEWRQLSLHFSIIFASIFNAYFEKQLFILFDLLNEIHLINYMHFDRSVESFSLLIERYWMILTIYGLQLKLLFSHSDLINTLNDVYYHKIMIHSPRIFMNYNLAMFSCEQGEGSISISNRVSKANGVCNDKDATIKRVLEYHVAVQEDMAVAAESPSSRVWKSVAIQLYTYKIDPDSATVKSMVNALVKKDQPYLSSFAVSDCLKPSRVHGGSMIKLNPLTAYSDQLNCIPENVFLPGEDTPCSFISEKNDIKLPAGLPRRDIPDPNLTLLQKEQAILVKHKKTLVNACDAIARLTPQMENIATCWQTLDTSVDTINDVAPESVLCQGEPLLHDLFPFVKEYFLELERKTERRKRKIYDKNAETILGFYDTHYKEQIETMKGCEERSLKFLQKVGGSFKSDAEHEYFYKSLIPHIRLHGSLLENTKKLLIALGNEVWKPSAKEKLIEKKEKQIEKLKEKVEVDIQKRREYRAKHPHPQPEITEDIHVHPVERISGRKRKRRKVRRRGKRQRTQQDRDPKT